MLLISSLLYLGPASLAVARKRRRAYKGMSVAANEFISLERK